ncbi:MAG TPA: hypothetical protein VFT45_06860, partial [Longimicrobium sp.]|nr:hypothetical protein [Longimicrobium sp.]
MTLRKGLFCLAALAFAAPSTLHAQDPAPVSVGAFDFYRRADEFTDDDRSFIVAEGEDQGMRDLALVWQCDEHGLNFAVATGFMGGDRDNKVVVRYRFDDDPPSQDELWTQSTEGRHAFAPARERPGITARARTANRVVFRVTDPLDGEVKTETFPLNGFTRAL